MSTKWYLAGPMTWIPQFNYPLFDEAARQLRLRGYDVVSPAEMDDPSTRALALASADGEPGSGSKSGQTWGDFLGRDVKLVADQVDGIIFLPDWIHSRGAKLEAFVGLLTNKRFAMWIPDSSPVELDRSVIQQMLKEYMP